MRLIDANLVKSAVREAMAENRSEELFIKVAEQICKMLDHAPTVDAVPVVRCKDCRYRNDLYVIGRAICNNEKGLMSTEIKDTDFCPYGERRVSDV